jgi:hypothetical protein
MKTKKTLERTAGYEYAEFLRANEMVNIDEMLTGTCDIPDGDYTALKKAGVGDPDPVEYWTGYNEYVRQRIQSVDTYNNADDMELIDYKIIK